MPHDVLVFGDSHWRVFFPFVNHGAATDNVSHEERGIRTIDTIANELSGSTIWGLQNPNSRHGARNRILATIDARGGADHVGLVFGEVDARYHHGRYFVDGELSAELVMQMLERYQQFIALELISTGRVTGNIFVYHGFKYPRKDGGTLGSDAAELVNNMVNWMLPSFMPAGVTLIRPEISDDDVAEDGVHLVPQKIYPRVLEVMRRKFDQDEGRA